MAKKAKKRVHLMPQLGWKDIILYTAGMFLTLGGSVVALFFPMYIRQYLSTPEAITSAAGKGYLCFVWLAIWLLMTGVFLHSLYKKRFPIFGRSDIEYGPPAYPRIFPLLMKNKPKYWQSPKAVARKRIKFSLLSCFVLLTFVFSVALYPRSFYGRYELLRDGTVTVYDTHNQKTEHYALGDIETVVFYTDYSKAGKRSPGHWHAKMALTFTDDESCSFSIEGFGPDWTTAIHTAQLLKESYGLRVSIEGEENLRAVVFDEHMNSEEARLLYELFETK